MADVRLIEGDCLEAMRALPAASVDAVVTSPPYAMQRKATYGGIPEREYPDWFVSVMEAIRPALAGDGSVLVVISEHVRAPHGMSDYVHRTRLAVRAAGWVEVDEIVWVKPNGPPVAPNGRPRRSWERVLWFAKRHDPYCQPLDYSRSGTKTSPSLNAWARRNGIGGTGSLTRPKHPRHPNFVVVPVGQDGPTNHPAAYPVKLARRLVSMMGRTILDPFMGSGTTGIACALEGRDFVGIDRDSEYVALARERIEAALPQAVA